MLGKYFSRSIKIIAPDRTHDDDHNNDEEITSHAPQPPTEVRTARPGHITNLHLHFSQLQHTLTLLSSHTITKLTPQPI